MLFCGSVIKIGQTRLVNTKTSHKLEWVAGGMLPGAKCTRLSGIAMFM